MENSKYCLSSLSVYCSALDQTQDLAYPRQAFYHPATSHAPCPKPQVLSCAKGLFLVEERLSDASCVALHQKRSSGV